MCLSTKWKNPKIAKRNIIVWKKFYNFDLDGFDFRSICWTMFWIINKLYKIEMNKWNHTIGRGLHSFMLKKEAKADTLKYSTIVKCIIPKGSLYYKGRRKSTEKYGCQIVSNQLKILPINK